ncbi:hypothetical protein H0H93_015201 [Arthromyces matolae]|nr:hypothetical protein H0H93_015201 [Arthromyces matolae]
MSFLARNALRAARRPAYNARSYASAPGKNAYFAERDAVEHHAHVAVCVAWVYNSEMEHKHHLDHLRAENDGKLPEVPAFEYMNRRSKPFPWGMNSLFFNPEANKDMSEE